MLQQYRSASSFSVVRQARGVLLGALLALVACAQAPSATPDVSRAASLPITTAVERLTPDEPCSDSFVRHTLDHTTIAGEKVVALYDSNGAGLAVNDLDGDGLLDIVLANLRGPNTILWNQGGMVFRTQHLSHGASRAVNIVDVDGDGLLDIVFTRQFASPVLWRNTGQQGNARFVLEDLPGVHNPFYSMNWGDLDGDGMLELVAGSYDTELRKKRGAIFNYQGGGVGVFVYKRDGATYVGDRLATEADALAIALPDVDSDGQPDIMVGNDFVRRDYIWLHTPDGWKAAEPFRRTSENTMSFDLGDIDNDGLIEIYSADMKPYNKDIPTLASWRPVMQQMSHPTSVTDPQITENVLQKRGRGGRFRNEAYQRSIDATGWSWSAKFGDLDSDGFLDIYAVNGMIAHDLLSYLPDGELKEQNQALRNDGTGYFEPMPEWGIGSEASGRGMVMADLDGDGDLDIVINNLQSPAELYENRLCGGDNMLVDLFWPTSMNTRAIGARLILDTSLGHLQRDVRAASGYLSGDAAQVHFGIPKGAVLHALQIHWPDGEVSRIDAPASQTFLRITR